MSENKLPAKNNFSPDWLVRGVLTKIGETFDKLTGRNWKPSSSLATSELIERLKKLLDSEVKDLGRKGKFVPHNIKLKMQWDKFSTDADAALNALETELLTAAIDHLNDKLYHTYAPLKLEVKPDYFTEGVSLLVSFDKFSEDEREVEMRVTLPDMKIADLIPPETLKLSDEQFIVRYTVNQIPKETKITFDEKRRLSVGRTKENDLTIEDTSISKIHAALVLNNENQLMVADTGSTNGTFINDERIGYGNAFAISPAAKVKFGTVEVTFEYLPKPTEILTSEDLPKTDAVEIDGFEFISKSELLPPRESEQIVSKEDNLNNTDSKFDKPADKTEAFGTQQGVVLNSDENSSRK